jgi:quinone-modifying oxidoreductase subunit QmoB
LDKKLGIYICSGCKIGNCLDVEKLSELTTSNGFAVCKTHKALCSVEGYQTILKDIEKESLTGIALAACSPREKTEVFDFPENIQLERINIRELAAWVSEPDEEDTMMLAEDYLRMGITKLNTTSLPEPYIADDINSEILVVGGGITGISAAIEGAKAGYVVHLFEKEEKLGGWAARLYKEIPAKEPFNQLVVNLIIYKLVI